MKGIMYDLAKIKVMLRKLRLAGPFSMVRYREDWAAPGVEHDTSVVVRTRLGGICGTDLHVMSLDMSYFASVLASPRNPFPMGHEVLGTVTAVGEAVTRVAPGDRVVLNPFPSCESYGFKKCASCSEGNEESCISLAGVGDGTPREARIAGTEGFGGMSGGGHCEQFTGFEGQLFKVPDNVTDEVAVLAEPFAVGLHAVIRNPPPPGSTVVVVGAGSIGLLLIAALNLLHPDCTIISAARYPFQAQAARRLGASHVFQSGGYQLYKDIVSVAGGRLFKPIIGKRGVYGGDGPAVIYDCVATERTLDDALHLVRSNGTIVVIGQGYSVTSSVDWSLQVLKEISVVGSLIYGTEQFDGGTSHTFDIALDLFSRNPELFKGIVTNLFGIADYKRAFRFAGDKAGSATIKAAFDFRAELAGQP